MRLWEGRGGEAERTGQASRRLLSKLAARQAAVLSGQRRKTISEYLHRGTADQLQVSKLPSDQVSPCCAGEDRSTRPSMLIISTMELAGQS